MNVQPRFTGTYVALATPFLPDGNFDETAYRRLIDHVIDGGVEGLVPMGTTGENPTMKNDEHQRAIALAVEAARGRVRVIAGSGSNDTDQAILMTRFARSAGAEASLSVTPYYNKPTQEGLVRHFSTIAEKADLPVVIYNVPGRTGSSLAPETLGRLLADPRIVAVKDATANLEQTMGYLRAARSAGRADFSLLSGDDALTLPMISIGAHGVISVVANEAPRAMSDMVRAALAGDFARARELHYRLLDLMQANFLESNPIPVKYALSRMGLMGETYRLPLCEMSAANKQKMDRILAALDLV